MYKEVVSHNIHNKTLLTIRFFYHGHHSRPLTPGEKQKILEVVMEKRKREISVAIILTVIIQQVK